MSSPPADYLLFSFDSSDLASLALDKVKNLDKARLIPLPPEIDAGCGFALRILPQDLDKALSLIGQGNYAGIFSLVKSDNERKITKIN